MPWLKFVYIMIFILFISIFLFGIEIAYMIEGEDFNIIRLILLANILVIDDKQNTFIAFMKKYKDNEWIWDSTNNFVFLPLITHWMPIPEFIDNI